MGRMTLLVPLLAAAVLAAGHAGLAEKPGVRFGMLGMDNCFSSGQLYAAGLDTVLTPLEPFFQAGVTVVPMVALGAQLGLTGTFPRKEDPFTHTPAFSFGPAVFFFPPPVAQAIQTYASAGGSMTYAFTRYPGWRVRLSAGVALIPPLPVALGIEAGWYHDWARVLRWNEMPPYRCEEVWLHGNTLFAGTRLVGFKR